MNLKSSSVSLEHGVNGERELNDHRGDERLWSMSRKENDLRVTNKLRGKSLVYRLCSSLRFRAPFIALRRGNGKPRARRRIDTYTYSSTVRSQRKYVSAGLLSEILLN